MNNPPTIKNILGSKRRKWKWNEAAFAKKGRLGLHDWAHLEKLFVLYYKNIKL